MSSHVSGLFIGPHPSVWRNAGEGVRGRRHLSALYVGHQKYGDREAKLSLMQYRIYDFIALQSLKRGIQMDLQLHHHHSTWSWYMSREKQGRKQR